LTKISGFFFEKQLCKLLKMAVPIGFFNQSLEDEITLLLPIVKDDFDRLFDVASDPLIWEQHPNKNRYQKPEFENYFIGAIESNGAYIVINKETGEVAGSTRFYDYAEDDNSVFIGYTFVARKFWGQGLNQSIKKLMLDHAFSICDKVYFHVGKFNIRSQIAMERLGGKKLKEVEVAYFGEPSRINFEYVIEKHRKVTIE
jgi:N-acetyltransferase